MGSRGHGPVQGHRDPDLGEDERGQASVVLAGGLLRSPGSDLREALAASLPDERVAVARLEPVHGALLMAADLSGVRPSLERLRASGPPDDFFSTTEPA